MRCRTPLSFAMSRLPFALALLLLAAPVWAQSVSSTLTEDAVLLGSDTAALDEFGNAVSISGNRLLIGAWEESLGRGAVYVFERNGGVWAETAKLTGSLPAPGDEFGSSVSLDGNRALIAAESDGNTFGSVYVFDLVGGVWTETVRISGGMQNTNFGTSVSLEGDRALIGASRDDNSTGDPGYNSGAAYVYDLVGGVWTETARLTASDLDEGDAFGTSVSLSGDRALIGASGNADAGTGSGAAYVFDLAGGIWTEAALLTGDGSPFGFSVSLDGDRALVGSYNDDVPGEHAGSAFVFEVDAGTWSQTAKLTVDYPNADDVGFSVALSGDRALLGAPRSNSSEGRAYLFDFAGGLWFESAALRKSVPDAFDRFGVHVALADGLAVIGATGDDTEGNGAGAAFAFDLDPIPPTLALTGVEGYRMLALPTGGTVSDLLGPLWTQGFPGSDDPTPADGFCSAYAFVESLGDFANGYTCLPSHTAPFPLGRGLFAYVYEDDAPASPGVQIGFPKVIQPPGSGQAAPFSAFPLTYTENPTSPAYQQGWNLLGNPFTEAVDWDLASRTGGLTAPIYVYDPNYLGGDYRSWTAGLGGDLADGVIPAFQGFFAKVSAMPSGLTIPANALVTNDGTYGRTAGPAPLRLGLAVVTDEGETAVSAAFVAPMPGGALGEDALDAYRLTPGAWPRTVLSTLTLGPDPVALAVNALPAESTEAVTVPVEIAAEGHAAGPLDLVLSWTGALPDGWRATLLDRATGERIAMTTGASHRLSVEIPTAGAKGARPSGLGLDLVPPVMRASEKAASGAAISTGDRLALVLTPPARTTTTEAGAATFALGPVSPNPTRGDARLPVTLPEAGEVTVTVVNATGRLVASVRQTTTAGSHRLAVPTAGLAPGVYVVRVQAPGGVASRRLTVVR
ncbi:MAG: T9SS type A sorting domain-containing protein [Bacteroidota bacterium]